MRTGSIWGGFIEDEEFGSSDRGGRKVTMSRNKPGVLAAGRGLLAWRPWGNMSVGS